MRGERGVTAGRYLQTSVYDADDTLDALTPHVYGHLARSQTKQDIKQRFAGFPKVTAPSVPVPDVKHLIKGRYDASDERIGLKSIDKRETPNQMRSAFGHVSSSNEKHAKNM